MLKRFSEFLGNSTNLEILQKQLISNSVPNAMLFFGPAGIGKRSLAIVYAASLNCLNRAGDDPEPCGECVNCKRIFNLTFPDVKLITRDEDRTTISIDQVRELKREASRTAYEGKYKVFIIDDSKELREQSNALLKLIEEPPPQTLIILITDNIMKQLPTILSRCQILKFQKLNEEDIKKFLERMNPDLLEEERVINQISGGSPGEIIKLSSIRLKVIEQSVLNALKTIKHDPFYLFSEQTHKIRSISPGSIPFISPEDEEIQEELDLLNGDEFKDKFKDTREFLLDWLNYTQMLLRDYFFLTNNYPEDYRFLRHISGSELQRLFRAAEVNVIVEIMKKIDSYRSAIERNANREITFLNFIIDLRKVLVN